RPRYHTCTDVPWLIVYGFFFLSWIAIIIYAFSAGSYRPMDSLGHRCEMDSEENRTNLFYFDMDKCKYPYLPFSKCQTPQVCLESCPNSTFVWDTMKDELSFEDLYSRLICLTAEAKAKIRTKEDIERAIDRKECARWYTKSSPYNHRCMVQTLKDLCEYLPDLPKAPSIRFVGLNTTEAPKASPEDACLRRIKHSFSKYVEDFPLLANLGNQATDALVSASYGSLTVGKKIIEDLGNSWFVILFVCICTLLVSLTYFLLMRFFSKQLLWFSICMVFLIPLGALGYTIYYFGNDPANMWHEGKYWFLASGVLFMILVFMENKRKEQSSNIDIVIALFTEASRSILKMRSTLIFPILSFVLFISAVGLTIATGLYLNSIENPSFILQKLNDDQELKCEGSASEYTVNKPCEPKAFQQNCTSQLAYTCSFDNNNLSPWTMCALIYNFICLVFLDCFIYDFSYMVQATKFSKYYWTSKGTSLINPTFFAGIHKHFGTVAKGSLCNTIKQMFRVLITVLPTLCAPIFSRLDTLMKFQYYNAYIICADLGTNLSDSGKDSSKLTSTNASLGFLVEQISYWSSLYSRIVLMTIAGLVTYCILPPMSMEENMWPTIFVLTVSYFITKGVFGVYATAVDTIYLCILEDYEENDG
ncbi:hypothetical protein KR084_012758, partial [Drosophila pseudotakahashii]